MSYINNVDGNIDITSGIGKIESIVTNGNVTTILATAQAKTSNVTGRLGIAQIIERDYNNFSNKPSINGITLEDNKTAEDLGLQPKGDYADKNDIPTKTSQLENDTGFLTEHQDLSDYAKKDEVPSKVSELENDSNFLTEHQDLTDYAQKTDIPDVSNFITKDVSNLTNYYNKNYIDNVIGDIETLLGGI